MRLAAPPFILTFSRIFFRVGLCPRGKLPLQDAWRHWSRRMRSRGVDRVDASPRDHHHKHVREIEFK